MVDLAWTGAVGTSHAETKESKLKRNSAPKATIMVRMVDLQSNARPSLSDLFVKGGLYKIYGEFCLIIELHEAVNQRLGITLWSLGAHEARKITLRIPIRENAVERIV